MSENPTPQQQATVGLYAVPAEVLALCLDELDAADLGRLASVSRAFREILSAPITWERAARKALHVDGAPRNSASRPRAQDWTHGSHARMRAVAPLRHIIPAQSTARSRAACRAP
jgi:hypothetical protein